MAVLQSNPKTTQVFPVVADNFAGKGDLKKGGQLWRRRIFCVSSTNWISSLMTKAENGKMFQAINGIEKSKKILVNLFPSIKSLDYDVREDLAAELTEN